MTDKAKNYTKEDEAKIVASYALDHSKESVLALATEMGKTTRSIIAKLSSLGVYKKIERKTKSGEAVIAKKDLVARISASTGLELSSLVKATKTDLQLLADNLG
jgi:electron transfer flavoprotein alpha subunit